MRAHHNEQPKPCPRRRVAGGDEGAIGVMVAILLSVALIGAAALTVDAGAFYSERRQMQTAADAAALAGVQELPFSPGGAVDSARQYALTNSPDIGEEDSDFDVGMTFAPNDTITAELVNPSMGLFFARVFGRDTTRVEARAVAVIGSPTTYGSGLMPFGVIANGTTQAPYGYSPGGVMPLVVDNGSQDQGNWHYVDLTPYTDGANNTKTVIDMGGTTRPVSIGTIIDTQTGSPNNPNFNAITNYFKKTCEPHGLEALVYDEERGVYEPTHESDGTHCNRLITVPVIVINKGDPYDWDSVTGKTEVRVVGFLNMFISNDPNFKDGALMAEFVQVVPVDAYDPGGYVDYAGVVYWLEE